MMKIDPRPAVFKSAWEEVSVVLVIMMAQLVNQAGTNLTLPMMNILGSSFSGITATNKVWFMASFPLTSGTLILISGRFGDLYGLKKVLMCGLAWSCTWALITGLSSYSHSPEFFTVCRAFHGVGLAFVLPSAIGVAGNIYPNGQRKALVFCAIAAMAPVGATLGCVFGALTAQFGHWTWAFYSMAIVLFIMLVLSWRVIPNIQVHKDAGKMDWIGSCLGVVGLILFNFAWNQAPGVGWSNPYIIVLVIVGFIAIVLFFYYEKRYATCPLLPDAVMNKQIALILACIFLGWSSFSIWTYYYWCFVLNLKMYTPLLGSATYGPLVFFGVIAPMVVSVLIRRVRPAYILSAAMCAFLIGIAMLSSTPVHQTYFNMIFAQMIILSFGMDMSFPAASLVMSDLLPKKNQGMASSLVSTVINYSMSIALGVAGTAEEHVLARGATLLHSYRVAMYVGVGFAGLAVLTSFVLIIASHYWPHIEERENETASEQSADTVEKV